MNHTEPLIADPRRAHTLPGRVYTDPAILAEEKDKIFARSWQYVTHASRLAEIGAYVATWLVGEGVFLIRGKDGEVRGFHNVCQHRAHELLRGSGRAKVITCPYHA
ncbi:MAG: hypothetical protein EXQ94_00895 [Alphaproteobacteria bacterium]|nr:hypothetical protein [Alphaproteobacteria bacterium]